MSRNRWPELDYSSSLIRLDHCHEACHVSSTALQTYGHGKPGHAELTKYKRRLQALSDQKVSLLRLAAKLPLLTVCSQDMINKQLAAVHAQIVNLAQPPASYLEEM